MRRLKDGARNVDFSRLLNQAAQLPGVGVDRSQFLRSALKGMAPKSQINQALAQTPVQAGVPKSVIEEAAKNAINEEAARTTALSVATGLPGGIAMVATVPADAAQYLGHMLRISQELAYLYSWPALFEAGEGQVDGGTKSVMTLFAGAMMGISAANLGIVKVANLISEQVVKTLPEQALTRGVVYPIVKKVADIIGAKMSERMFADSVSKVVPLVGAAVSGGLTWFSFKPMCTRLQRQLAFLQLANDGSSEEDSNEARRRVADRSGKAVDGHVDVWKKTYKG
ncbi:hypothetical protein [Bifidobacterium bombi]|uniref:hypothetical protein n=1 Tax=Bifidobacterium bombi TaxID=471511 RepID=UPI00187D70CC|nr:hypothetical protein [Bifidobacterium bombi]